MQKCHAYQSAKVEPNCGEITRQHTEEIEPMPQPINVTAQCLLAIPIGYLCLKHGDLIKTNISPFTNLDVLMVCDITFT